MGFFEISLITGFLPHTQMGKSLGQVHPPKYDLKDCLTILSSKEWNEITASLPPDTRFAVAESINGLIASSSPLTSILIAWKVLLAGWGPSALAALGIALLMISVS